MRAWIAPIAALLVTTTVAAAQSPIPSLKGTWKGTGKILPGAGLDRMFAAFDAASKRTAHMPAIDTITAIAEQYGVVIHPPAG
jgi:hypothetical protein